jgi:hypothetical protein
MVAMDLRAGGNSAIPVITGCLADCV